ncbi:MAG: S41 family peptidase [Pseudomonadota bacterium]
MQLRPITLIGIVMSMVTGIALGITGYHSWLDYRGESAESQTFEEVLNQVHESYVDEVDRRELVSSALRGMLDDLDDHSNYLDTRDYEDLQDETNGRFGGVGVELGLVDDFFTVIAPLDDTPASRAGLASGDRIIALNEEPLRGRKLMEVVDMLRGEPGSDVNVSVLRPEAETSFDVTLTRAEIRIASVRSRMIEPGYGYVRISQFQASTAEEFRDALDDLIDEDEEPLAGLILDLRNNPGGVLQASVSVADAFLTDGLIVYTEGRLPSSHLKYRASGRDALEGAPVVVLINSGSASAAEIVAGALQDHDRAELLGATSYGKGSVQSVMPLSGDRALKLTTAYYYTPKGRTIHRQGIEPDVSYEPADDDALMNEALAILKTGAPSEGLHARL